MSNTNWISTMDISPTFLTKDGKLRDIKLRRSMTFVDTNNKFFEKSKLAEVHVVPRYTSARIMIRAMDRGLRYEFGPENSGISFQEEEILNNPHMFIFAR